MNSAQWYFPAETDVEDLKRMTKKGIRCFLSGFSLVSLTYPVGLFPRLVLAGINLGIVGSL